MKIELKNIKHMESMSEETNCYTATLHVDGRKIGEVSNAGHGGPDIFHGDQEAFDRAGAWLRANMPPLESRFGGDPLEMDMELYCGQFLETWLMSRDLKKSLRSRVVFTEPGRDGIFEIRFKGCRKVDDRHLQVAREKHPRATILNAIPFQEALAIYCTAG